VVQDKLKAVFSRWGRPKSFRVDNGKKNWSLSRATEHLAGYGITRRVDRGGKVSIYERPYYVGTPYTGKRVHIGFDPEQLEWIFSLEDGTEIRSRPAVEISRAQIRRLEVTNRRNSRVRRPR